MIFKYDKEEILDALRELTKLGPIARIKIKRANLLAKKEAIKNKQEKPNEELRIDYSIANDLELQLRMVELASSLTNIWQNFVSIGEYRSGLSDYVRDYLNEYIDDKKKENPTKTIK